MRFHILGPLEVERPGGVISIGARKQRAVLALLLINAGRVVSLDRLVDDVWGEDPPETAANALQVYISGLRKLLDPDRPKGSQGGPIARRAEGYVLEVAPEQVDAQLFEKLVREGRSHFAAGRPADCADTMARALALWRGPALADFSYDAFAQAEIDRLESLRMSAVDDRIRAELDLGRHAALVPELEALVARHPLREDLRGHLVLALYRSGRQAEALSAYADARRVLDEELGIDPSPALRALETGILRQDPALSPPEVALASPTSAAASPARAMSCPGCGALLPPGRDLCAACSAERGGVADTRKTVTALCVELSTAVEGLDPEALHGVTTELFDEVAAVARRHGGSARWAVGDQMLAVFGIPVVHEDDAARAVRAAVEIREDLPKLCARAAAPGLSAEAHFGISTGEVIVPASGAITERGGEAIGLAAKLCNAADAGEILLSPQTLGLVRSGVTVEQGPPLAARGRGRITPLRVVATRDGIPATVRRLDAPLVGRRAELSWLLDVFDAAVDERACRLVTVLGVPGVGKSRLAAELVGSLPAAAATFVGRCRPYGEGVTFLPVAEVVRRAAGLHGGEDDGEVAAALGRLLEDESDGALVAERLAQLIGAAPAFGALEDGFWAVRRFLDALARRRPVVVVFDDLHWAEASMLDLVEHVAERSQGVPLLVVCLARPDLLQARPVWAQASPPTSTTRLEPLGAEDSDELLRNLLGGELLDDDVGERIVRTADGNPLFLEEMTRMLIDEGVLRRDGRRWVASADPPEVAVPPTIQALLAARLDRLEAGERRVIELAAVVGTEFDPEAVASLWAGEHPRLADDLAGLESRDLVRGARGRGGTRYRFRHALIQQAAYDRVTKSDRARLHERLASWLEAGGAADGSDEKIGFHLERACALRRELGRDDEVAAGLARRASTRLAAAGRGASLQGNFPSGINLAARAAAVLPPEDGTRLELLVELGAYLMDGGDIRSAEATLRGVLEEAERRGDRRLAARASVQVWEARALAENLLGWREEALRDVAGAVEVFAQADDESGLARALYLEAMVHRMDYRFALADHALERALEHARAAGDEPAEARIHSSYALSSLWGPARVSDAIERYRALFERFRGNRMIEAGCLRGFALLAAMQGRFDEARATMRRSSAIVAELGSSLAASTSLVPGMIEAGCLRGFALLAAMQGRFDEARATMRRSSAIVAELGSSLAASTSLVPGMIEMLAGDLTRAEGEFRSSYEVLERAGERSTRATAAAFLARVLFQQGRLEEAERHTVISRRLAPEDDLAAKVEWATTHARILARRGLLDEADALAREVVDIARGTDDLETQAEALVAAADVVRHLGRVDDCTALLRQALALHERKGNVVGRAAVEVLLKDWSRPLVIDLRETARQVSRG
jgi:DNA-binding SARP family transcriptional activator/class 3 adenylate cyclase/tetratricopeptide (TPR) repeat protein